MLAVGYLSLFFGWLSIAVVTVIGDLDVNGSLAPSLVRIMNPCSGHLAHGITWFLFLISHSTVVEGYWHENGKRCHQVYPNKTGYLIHLNGTHCVETLRKRNHPTIPRNLPALGGNNDNKWNIVPSSLQIPFKGKLSVRRVLRHLNYVYIILRGK